MPIPPARMVTASSLGRRLQDLAAERAAAALEGVADHPLYRSDLETEIDAVRAAYVGVAVTELATLRGELSGRPQG